MFSSKSVADRSHEAIESAAASATQWADQASDAVSRTRGAASEALGYAEGRLRGVGDQLAPSARQVAQQAQDLAARGIDAARYGSQQMRDAAALAAQRGTRYVREEPVKSIAIAALAGVAVYALVRLLNQSRYGR